MSFDLAVLALAGSADRDAARRMYDRCGSGFHDDGEPDGRIAAFYEQLRLHYPDTPPHHVDSPWMSIPLDVGIDHVIMHLGASPPSFPAIERIQQLAAKHGLVVYDPQSGDTYLPDSADGAPLANSGASPAAEVNKSSANGVFSGDDG